MLILTVQLLWLPREIGTCDFILWTQMNRLQNVRGEYSHRIAAVSRPMFYTSCC